MNIKTMEGLVGSNINMELLNTPFRVYKEARRKEDTATMERAMGYVVECSDKAQEYKEETKKGMQEDAETAKEKEKLELEKAIQKRKEEQENLEETIEENKNEDINTDMIEVSEEGKALLQENSIVNNTNSNSIGSDRPVFPKTIEDKPFAIYTRNGTVNKSEQNINISISI